MMERRTLAGHAGWTTEMLQRGLHGGSYEQLHQLLPPSINEKEISCFFDRHAIAPALQFLLNRSASSDGVTNFSPASIKDRSRVAQARSLLLGSELERIARQFDHNSIEMVPWRGPVLSKRLFGESWIRESSDLDLLIGREDANRASASLCTLGFEHAHGPGEKDPGPNDGHCIEFTHPDRPMSVELHTRPLPPNVPFGFSSRDLISLAKDEVSLGNYSYRAFLPEVELILMSAHAGKHLWSRLLWTLDIAAFGLRYPDLNHSLLASLAKESRSQNCLRISLELSELLFDSRWKDEVWEIIGRSKSARRIAHQITTVTIEGDLPLDTPPRNLSHWLQIGRFRARTRDSKIDQWMVLWNFIAYLLTPNENDRAFAPGVRLPLLLAAVARPVRLLFRYRKRILLSQQRHFKQDSFQHKSE